MQNDDENSQTLLQYQYLNKYKIINYMQLDSSSNLQQTTISFSDLMELDKQFQKGNYRSNQFAAYINHPQNRKLSRVELIAKDTNEIPKIPIRRVCCENCRTLNISCQTCENCKICCSDLGCIYDYQQWNSNPNNPIYQKCECFKQNKQLSSSVFDIDWRLMNIMSKIENKKSATHRFFLNLGGGMMWITEQNSAQRQFEQCDRIYYEDNFGLFYFHEKLIKQTNSSAINNLNQSNIRNFTNLLKINIKKFLAAKDTWEVSNLEEECQEIADNFYSNKKLEILKANMQNPPTENLYSNMPSLKYQGKQSQTLVSQSNSKIETKNDYKGCSEFINDQIIFYYCSKSNLMFVRNAKFYEGDTQSSNIRGIKIIFIDNTSHEDAIWFKDRKGDIFAINNNTLSIFKFNVLEKCYIQFWLATQNVFVNVKMSSALIYIYQKDIVYYFDAKQFTKSFCFSLYRPKGTTEQNKLKKDELSKNSCTNIIIDKECFKETKVRSGQFCKAIYIMEDYKFIKGKDERKELVPIIYLLIERKLYLPLGIGVHKIVHTETVSVIELPSIGTPLHQGNEIQKVINFNLGVFFVLRFEKSHRLYYFTLMDGKSTLLNAKILQKQGSESLSWSDDTIELNGCNQIKIEAEKQAEIDHFLKINNYMVCSSEQFGLNKNIKSHNLILINDILGIPGNNEVRLLGSNDKTGRIVEIHFSYNQGVPNWQIYDLR